MDIQELSALIKGRRSVFPEMYIQKEVSDSLIESLLENAIWAPNHRLTQPWRFIVFKDEGLIKLGNFLAETYKEMANEMTFSEKKYEKTRNKSRLSGAVIAAILERDTENRVPNEEEIMALAMAVQNILLSCESAGLGAYFSTPGSVSHAGNFMNLQHNQRCLGLVYLGYKKDVQLISQRRPLKEVVRWIKS
jgi:nitroreductase